MVSGETQQTGNANSNGTSQGNPLLHRNRGLHSNHHLCLEHRTMKSHSFKQHSVLLENANSERLKDEQRPKFSTLKRSPLRKMSKAKAKEHRKYILARARALPGKICEWPSNVCTQPADDIHHLRGRRGKMLTDQRYWMFICRDHHRYIHDHAKESRQMGLLK